MCSGKIRAPIVNLIAFSIRSWRRGAVTRRILLLLPRTPFFLSLLLLRSRFCRQGQKTKTGQHSLSLAHLARVPRVRFTQPARGAHFGPPFATFPGSLPNFSLTRMRSLLVRLLLPLPPGRRPLCCPPSYRRSIGLYPPPAPPRARCTVQLHTIAIQRARFAPPHEIPGTRGPGGYLHRGRRHVPAVFPRRVRHVAPFVLPEFPQYRRKKKRKDRERGGVAGEPRRPDNKIRN